MLKKINYKVLLSVFLVVILILMIMIGYKKFSSKVDNKTCEIEGTILEIANNYVTIEDSNNNIYKIKMDDSDLTVGEGIYLSYTGLLDNSQELQSIDVISYTVIKTSNDSCSSYYDDGIFSDYYKLTCRKLESLTLDEKIGQIFLVRYDSDETAVAIQEKYQFAGYVFYEKDFKDKTKSEVIEMIDNINDVSNIPLLTAVDEEGGSVVRVSSNTNLIASPFKSPGELYSSGGFDLIKSDTITKSNLLYSLGLNVNLAPVVDVSTDSEDYMYERTLKEETSLVSTYAETVIKASLNTGVSYTLKHFPGYGNNSDTHNGISIDTRSYDSIIKNDLPPFEAGIDAGAEAILVSHNIVTSIDDDYPASLSKSVHSLLTNDLDFTGVVITDDISMGALDSYNNVITLAIKSGNDLIITTDYEESVNDVKTALVDGTITEEQINKMAFKVLAWKYYKGLIYDK